MLEETRSERFHKMSNRIERRENPRPDHEDIEKMRNGVLERDWFIQIDEVKNETQ